MNRRIAFVSLCASLLVLASSGQADPAPTPTSEQRHFINDCAVMSQAVLVFAKARDQGMAKMDAFTYVTHGQVTYDPGSQVDQTLQWAFDHPDEDPTTVTAHFHGHCTLDAWELLTPIAEKELTTAVQDCQRDQSGKPDKIRQCIDGKTSAMVASANALNSTPETTDLAVAPPPEPQAPLPTVAAPLATPPRAVSAPPSAVVPAPTQLAMAAPPEVQAPKLAMATVPAGAPVASVPAPQFIPPEPTNVAAAPPPAIQAPKVAMAAVPAGAPVASVPAPQFIPPEPTQVAVLPPSEVQTTKVAMASVPAGAPVAPVPAPQFIPPEPTNVAAEPPPAVQAPEVAMTTVPAGTPVTPVSAPTPVAVPAPQLVAAAAPAAAAPTPVAKASAAPTSTASVPQLAVAADVPASLAGIGRLSIGMSMDDAKKALGSYGQDDTDQDGNPARTFLVSDGHGYIELTTEAGKPEVVYGIEYHGGADAKVPSILGVRLGDGAADVLTHVGQPSKRASVLDDRTLWSYAGRNYSFELSSGGDLITIRIEGYDGLPQAVAPADGAPTPVAP
jgi:hypothetical protein